MKNYAIKKSHFLLTEFPSDNSFSLISKIGATENGFRTELNVDRGRKRVAAVLTNVDINMTPTGLAQAIIPIRNREPE